MATTLVLLTRRPERRAPLGIRVVAWQPDGTARSLGRACSMAQTRWSTWPASPSPTGAGPRRKAALIESRLLSTRSLVAAIDGAKSAPAGAGQQSAVGYYGPRGDELLTEADGPATISSRGCRGLGARRAGSRVRGHTRRAGADGARARARRRRTEGDAAAISTRRRRSARVRQQYWPWIHRADWVALMRFLLDRPTLQGARQRDRTGAGDQRGVLPDAGARAPAPVPVSRAGLRPATRDGRDGRRAAAQGTARRAGTRAGDGVQVRVRDAGAGASGDLAVTQSRQPR